MSRFLLSATNAPFLAPTALATIALLALSASAAHAQATMFTDRTTFLATVAAGSTTINFDSAATGDLTDYSTAAGLTISGVNFVGNLDAGGNFLDVVRPAFYPTYQGWNGNPTVLGGPSGSGNTTYSGAMTVTLPAGVTAVGTDLYTVAQGDNAANTVSPVLFTLSNGQTFSSATFENPELAFAGFTSATPITSITITAPAGANTFPDLSNFVFGQAISGAAAPEPGSIALLGSIALPLAGLIARRRRPRAAAPVA